MDIVIGAEFQQLATSTEVNQSLVELGEPEVPPGACAAPAEKAAKRDRAVAASPGAHGPPAASSSASSVVQGAEQRRRRGDQHLGAGRRAVQPGRPAGPASVATSPPAAWSQGFRPFSKYASTVPSAAMHRSSAAAPNRRMSRTRVIRPASTAPWCARRRRRRTRSRWPAASGRAWSAAEPVSRRPSRQAPPPQRRGPLVAGGGVAHHAGHHHAVHLGGQRDGVLRQPVEVVHRAVDRVEDPAHRRPASPAPPSRRTPRPAPRRPAARARSASTTWRSTARSAAVTTSVSVLLVCTSVIASARIRRAVAAASRAIRTAIASNSPGVDVAPIFGHVIALSAGTILPPARSREVGDPPRRAGGVRRREDLAGRRYNSPLPPLHGRSPAGPSASRGLPHHTGQPRRRALRWAPGRVIIASGRSFVTEAHQTGADVRSLTEALIAHAQGAGGQITSAEVVQTVESAEVTPAQAKKILRALVDAGVTVVVDGPPDSPPQGRRRPRRHARLQGHHRQGARPAKKAAPGPPKPAAGGCRAARGRRGADRGAGQEGRSGQEGRRRPPRPGRAGQEGRAGAKAGAARRGGRPADGEEIDPEELAAEIEDVVVEEPAALVQAAATDAASRDRRRLRVGRRGVRGAQAGPPRRRADRVRRLGPGLPQADRQGPAAERRAGGRARQADRGRALRRRAAARLRRGRGEARPRRSSATCAGSAGTASGPRTTCSRPTCGWWCRWPSATPGAAWRSWT